MGTLDRWRALAFPPKTLEFPSLELIGRDFDPPIATGSGQIRMPSTTQIEFVLNGLPSDIAYAIDAIKRQQGEPYNIRAQFRLRGTDSTGIEWSLGWASPHVQADDEAWSFVGEVDVIEALVADPNASAQQSTEILYVLPPLHPAARAIDRFVSSSHDGTAHREYRLEVLGSSFHFRYEPAEGALSVTASTPLELPVVYLENWIGEPLRILLGQLIYPRLIVRNVGDGKALIFVRRTPGYTRSSTATALWQGEEAREDREGFWNFYASLLTIIARAGGFESHNITRLYEEVIQATRGSRWVWAMTCASAIEALVKMLEPPRQVRLDVDADAASELIGHIKKWSGSRALKRSAANGVRQALKTTPTSAMGRLVRAGVISKAQSQAWKEVRNHVMHGNLISPYPTGEEENANIMLLAATMRALTREFVRRAARN